MDTAYINPTILEIIRSFPRFETDDGARGVYLCSCIIGGRPFAPLDEAVRDELDFAVPLYAEVHMFDLEEGTLLKQLVYLCYIPVMLENGHFIIDGLERVIPPRIEPLPDGSWRTLDLHEVVRREMKAAIPEVEAEIANRLYYWEWEDLEPEDLIDPEPFITAIQEVFDLSPILDGDYHLAADDCLYWPHEEPAAPRLFDYDGTRENTGCLHEEPAGVPGAGVLLNYLFSEGSFGLN